MKPEWGTKHNCANCGAYFYDMRKPDAVCPKCGTPINDAAALKKHKGDVEDLPPEKKDDDYDLDSFDDIETDGDDTDAPDEFLEDTSELDSGDDPGVSEIMEHVEEGEESNL